MNKTDKILGWYEKNRRCLPWRSEPGEEVNPYHVWLSEIMLQQTTVVTVKSYFDHFITVWPNIAAVASAPLDDILHAWQGLGYYSRARNLHKCAKILMSEHSGFLPQEEKELLKLPGIGSYTAAAIAAIAFGKKTTPIDGNIERVVARLFSVTEPISESKKKIQEFARSMTPEYGAGDYAQALMDIGATICKPKTPICASCPLSGQCEAEAKGMAKDLPVRLPKKDRPTRKGIIFWLSNGKGEILLRRRPEKGLLGGMMELPSSDWSEDKRALENILNEAPENIVWQILPGKVKHTFTHFNLELEIATGQCLNPESMTGIWCEISNFSKYALPSVMKKVVIHALRHNN